MRTHVLTALVLSALAAAGQPARADAPTQILGQVVDPQTHRPVEGVVVTIAGPPGQRELVTDANGLYRSVVPEPGTYTVTFTYADAVTTRTVKVASGAIATADATAAPAGETIVIHGRIRPPVLPVPKKDPRILPKYSDAAVEHDAWTKAWMLLDIDRTGAVRRVKFLKRPGYDLDQIAVNAALDTRFEPARDSSGAAVPTLMVWPIEWPSYWWMVAMEGVVTRRPKELPDGFDIAGLQNYTGNVPCANSGLPLHLDSVHPVYRDCSKPDLTKADREPWIDAAQARKGKS